MGIFRDLRQRPLGDHLSPVRPCPGSKLNEPVRLGEDLGIVVHQQHRIPVRQQVPHHTDEACQVGGVKADGWLVQHIEHPCGAVPHRPGQLHPLPFPGGEGGGGPVQRQVAQAQVQQPPGRSEERFADALRHGAHFLRKGGRNPLHPVPEGSEGHFAYFRQREVPEAGRPGPGGEAASAAVGTDILF